MRSVARRLILPAVAVATLGLPTCAAAHSKTTATIFRAFTSNGTPTIHTRSKSGYCWTGSLTAVRNDAWRCFVGNYIYDPCFSSSHAHGIVVCPNLQVNGGIEIRLTRRLPQRFANHPTPSLSDQPWNIELISGKHCAFSSGATTLVHGERLNYFCGVGNNNGLWGYANRRSEPWTILIAPFNATTLHDRRAIRHVWM
jgi:hypothetical protein